MRCAYLLGSPYESLPKTHCPPHHVSRSLSNMRRDRKGKPIILTPHYSEQHTRPPLASLSLHSSHPPPYWSPNPALSPQVPLTSPKPCFIFLLFLSRCYISVSQYLSLLTSISQSPLSHHPFPSVPVIPTLFSSPSSPLFWTTLLLKSSPSLTLYLCPQDSVLSDETGGEVGCGEWKIQAEGKRVRQTG